MTLLRKTDAPLVFHESTTFTPVVLTEVQAKRGWNQTWRFTCSACGKSAENTYSEPSYSRMLMRGMCFTCDFWTEKAKELRQNIGRVTIIDGATYFPGSGTSGPHRGMAGRRFDIEYIKPSEFAGRRITCEDLWSGGVIPEIFRGDLPDTARFINGAEKVQVGDITCFNPSEPSGDRYSPASSLAHYRSRA